MFLLKLFVSSISTAIVTASVCSAGSVVGSEMPTRAYGDMAAKLIGSGYTEIRLVNQDQNQIVAIDESGSEVLLVVDPLTRQILRKSFIHAWDE
jgi:hypothetical protein